MKKAFILSALLACSSASFAGFSANGQAAAQTAVQTVASLKSMPDDSYVTLEGHIEKQTRHEHYIFRDATGSTEVEIDDDVWRGQNVTPRDKVRLTAKIDKEWTRTEVEVKAVAKIQ